MLRGEREDMFIDGIISMDVFLGSRSALFEWMRYLRSEDISLIFLPLLPGMPAASCLQDISWYHR